MLRQLVIINQIIGKKMEKKIPVVTLMHYIDPYRWSHIKKRFSLTAASSSIFKLLNYSSNKQRSTHYDVNNEYYEMSNAGISKNYYLTADKIYMRYLTACFY